MSLFQVTKKQALENYELRTMTGDIVSFTPSYSQLLPDPFSDLNVECSIVATGGNGTPDNPNPIVGYSSASITRCGVNLFDGTWEIGYRWESDGTYISKPNTNAGTPNKMPCKPNTSYTFVMDNIIQTTFFYLSEFDISENHIQKSVSMRILPSDKTVTFTTGANTYFMAFSLFAETAFTSAEVSKTGVNYPSTDTTYHAYNGSTVTIAFGQTVYGGVLDVTSGKLTVTYLDIDMGSATWNIRSGTTDTFYTNPTNAKARFNGLCSYYPKVTTAASDLGDKEWTSTGGNNLSFWFRDTDFDNYTGAQVASALTGQRFIYELATPFDIDLTPEVISAVVGENNVFADCEETTVTCLI